MIKILALIALTVCLTGCGHNALVFSKGRYMNLGYDPTGQKVGVQYVNGEQVTIVNRENTKLTVEMKDTLDAAGKKTQAVSKITYEIGDQKNGYNTGKD